MDWSKNASALALAERSEGCYLLRSNVSDWTGEELWKAYIQLTEAESAFRMTKDDLQLRPVWHHIAERVQRTSWCVSLRTSCGRRLRVGRTALVLAEAWRRWSRSSRIQSTDVILPTTDGRTVRLRCVVRPDRAQTILLQRLGLQLPKRLRIAKGVVDL